MLVYGGGRRLHRQKMDTASKTTESASSDYQNAQRSYRSGSSPSKRCSQLPQSYAPRSTFGRNRSTFGWDLGPFYVWVGPFYFLGGRDPSTCFWLGPFYFCLGPGAVLLLAGAVLLLAGAVLLLVWTVLLLAGAGLLLAGSWVLSSSGASSGPLGLFGAFGEPVGGLWGSSGAEASVLRSFFS